MSRFGVARGILGFAWGLVLVACGRAEPSSTGQGAPRAGEEAPRAPSAETVRVADSLIASGRVRTAAVTRRAPTGALKLPGDVVATPEGAAEAGALLPGRVARFEVREGDRVKRGQVLAWLDAPEAARAVADLVRARTRAETQARKAARIEGLIASEAATQVALDEARLELELARADLAASRTLVASLGLSEPASPPSGAALPAQLPVRSPVDGVVVERAASLGAHVSPERSLFRMVSEGRVLVEARVADVAGIGIPPASVARVRPRGGASCPAVVVGALPQVDPATRTRRVRLTPDAACVGLVPGGQVEVAIELAALADGDGGRDGELTVPAPAVVDFKAAKIVFVKKGEGSTFEVRPVEPGSWIGDQLVVRAGLSEGNTSSWRARSPQGRAGARRAGGQ